MQNIVNLLKDGKYNWLSLQPEWKLWLSGEVWDSPFCEDYLMHCLLVFFV